MKRDIVLAGSLTVWVVPSSWGMPFFMIQFRLSTEDEVKVQGAVSRLIR